MSNSLKQMREQKERLIKVVSDFCLVSGFDNEGLDDSTVRLIEACNTVAWAMHHNDTLKLNILDYIELKRECNEKNEWED